MGDFLQTHLVTLPGMGMTPKNRRTKQERGSMLRFLSKLLPKKWDK
jgi:hypothetical protein